MCENGLPFGASLPASLPLAMYLLPFGASLPASLPLAMYLLPCRQKKPRVSAG
jgi:hypothetical protein